MRNYRKRFLSILMAAVLTVPQAGLSVSAADMVFEEREDAAEQEIFVSEETEDAAPAVFEETETGQEQSDSSVDIMDGDLPEEFTEGSTGEMPEGDTEGFDSDRSESDFTEPDGEESLFGDGSESPEELFSSGQEVIYDAAQLETFKNRTFQDVVNHYSNARLAGESYLNRNRDSWYQVPSSTSAPYAAGVLTEDTHKAMTAMADFYRWLVGVQPLKNASHHSDSLQAQALVRNFEFNHYISSTSKPSDMSDDLWNYGAPCRHNILARGYTPQGAITGWMNEGYSLSGKTWDTVGHRFALIGSSVSDLQFGYSGYIAIGDEASFENKMTEPFAAFPAPGYMPNTLVYPGSSSWTVELNTSVISVPDRAQVTVKVTNLSTGKSYSCTSANNLAQVSGSYINFVQPSDYSSGCYTGSYRVEITGLQDVSSKAPAKIQYTTEFTDVTNYLASYVESAASEIEEYVIYKTMSDKESLQKIAAILPQKVQVTAESGMKVSLPVTGAWKLDEANRCFVNSADAKSLPGNLTDKNHILDRIMIAYSISDGYYDSFNSLNLSSNSIQEGEFLRFFVYRTLVSTDTSQIFKLTSNGNGTYSAVKKYDSAVSPEFDAKASEESTYSAYHIYNRSSVKQEDAGEYISVYFDSDDSWGGTEVYVSTSTQTLKVSHAYDSGKTTKPATCTQTGIKTYTCTQCGASREEKIAATGHSWGSWTTVTAATYTKEGSQKRVCRNCSESETKAIPKKKLTSLKTPKLGSAKAVAYNKIKVTWGKVPYATGYTVLRKTSGKKWTALKSVSSGTTYYTDAKAVTGTKYTYTVRAYFKSGTTSIQSKYNTKGVSATAKLGKVPAGTLITSSRHRNKLTWKKVAGATGYQVYCKAGKNGKYVKVKTTGGTSFTHTNRKKGTVYYYKVRAYRKVSSKPNKYVYGSFSSVKSIKSK